MAKSKKEVIEDLDFDEVIEKKSRSSSKREIHISEPYLPDCFKPVPLYGRKYVDIYKHDIDTNSSKEFEKTDDDYINRLRAMARKNDEAALNELGVLYYSMGKRDMAVDCFFKAAKQDYPEAQRNLAIAFEADENINPKEIFYLYDSAAASEDIIALNNLGCCYLNGEGTDRDYKKAVECFEKAAAHKDDLAHLNLAVCYTFGLGVERNLEKSLELYKQAADLGNKPALKKIAEIYYRGRCVEPDKRMALKYYRKAAEAGDKDSEKMVRLITGKDKPKTKGVLPDKAVEAEKNEPEKVKEKTAEKAKTQNQPLKTKSKKRSDYEH
ncbi:MAG: sel1 repeat family protein [Clostridiales bacterium]|nr:sel1 repeat family protein [Clostridiales bacterium]